MKPNLVEEWVMGQISCLSESVRILHGEMAWRSAESGWNREAPWTGGDPEQKDLEPNMVVKPFQIGISDDSY